MLQTVSANDFKLHEIEEEFRKDFFPTQALLPDMLQFLLELVGKALMSKKTEQYCWAGGAFEWWYDYPEEGRSEHHRVFFTKHGNLMYENLETEQMFRVS